MEHVPDAPDYLDVGTTLLPLGDITMIVGGPGLGKSTLLAAIAMAASSIRTLERGTEIRGCFSLGPPGDDHEVLLEDAFRTHGCRSRDADIPLSQVSDNRVRLRPT